MRERDVFIEALQKERAEERAAYLNAVCGDDPGLRERVNQLILEHEKCERFLLDAPPPGISLEPTLHPLLSEGCGWRIGPYKLLQEIGQGGMGIVYLAEQQTPVRRRVALKIIKPGMDSRQVIARFEAERQTLAMMDHPNIAKVLDAGVIQAGDQKLGAGGQSLESDSPAMGLSLEVSTSPLPPPASSLPLGRPYFVMELVKGQPITEYCDAHKLTPRQRLEMLLPVCQAIQHAHQKGIIHRDIKPSNILVAEYDQQAVPKVIDFGVAKAVNQSLTEETMFTGLDQIVGTLEYMSPEQAKVNQLDIDTRSDIYSLGVLMYELLTGTTPFDKQRLRSVTWDEMLRIIREEEPPRPSLRLSLSHALPSIAANRQVEPKKLSTQVRRELDWIVMKALEKERARRYDTAKGLANDIQRYLNDEPVAARPASAAYRFRKFARRNKAAFATAAFVVAAVLVGTGFAMWQAVRATRAEGKANQHLAAEQQAHQRTKAAERAAQQQLFNAYHAQAQAIRLSGRPGQRLDALEAIVNAARLREPLALGEEARDALRDAAVGSLELVDLRPVKTWVARQNVIQGGSALSADFELSAFSEGESIHVRRLDHPTSDLVTVPTAKGAYEQNLRFDPTNRYLLRLRTADRTAYVTEIATGNDILAAPDTLQFSAADFHPSRPLVAVGDRHGMVRCFDLVSGQEVRHWSVGRPIWSVKYDPWGERLAVGTERIDVCDAETGEAVFSTPRVGVQTVLDWRPDGKWLAVGTTPDLYLFEVGGEGRAFVLQGHRSTIIGLQFHPHGQLLASTSWDGTTRIWDAVTGQQLLRLEGNFRRFSDDGRWMAVLLGLEVSLLEVVSPCAHRWLSRGMTYGVAVAPDDRLMAACHDDGVRLWDLRRLEEVAHLPIDTTRGVAFRAPEGQLLTSGKAGLYQWPVRTVHEGSTERVIVGPPEAVETSLSNMRSVGANRDGSVLLAETFYRDEAVVFRWPDSGPRQVRLTAPHLALAALSPDGRWAAASCSLGVRVWDAETGEHVCDLSTPIDAHVCFSPDNRTVITNSGQEVRIWDTERWNLRHATSFKSDGASAIAFTPDSRVAVIGVWGVGAKLIDVATGRHVATLDLPERPPVYLDLAFTSDGSRLIAAADHTGCCVWDFRDLRDQLAALDLDWSQPPLREDVAATDWPPLQVEVELGDLAGEQSQ